ncbi:MAG TPA: hypothetical protein VK508_16550 [Cyclobacteriaceae bacterium]|nr:hypothetical protein [Cyclobacteriaceae bacterium]
MTTAEQKVLILKSNISTYADLLQVRHPLDHHPGITRWNIDLDDCDHVIRIVTPNLSVSDIQEIVNSNGYQCSELE